MIIAPIVIYTEPNIIGRIPKEGGVFEGFHCVPSRKFFSPYSLINGRPSLKINTHINIIAKTDVIADKKNINFIKASNDFLFIILLYHPS